MVPMLLGLASKLNTLLDRLSSLRAGYLDRLDATISSRASASVWTSALASKLNALELTSQSEELTTPETSSWTVPANVSLVWVTLVGGGGSGTAKVATWNVSSSSAGGAGGASLLRIPYPVTPGGTVTYEVGAGGAAQNTTSTSTGVAGGNTTFGTLTALGGAGGSTTDTATTGLLGGISAYTMPGAGSGDTVNPAYPGGSADAGSYHTAYGGGGSFFGAGGNGDRHDDASVAQAGTRGGGGGGAITNNGTGNTATSGKGGDGYILIEWVGSSS